MSHKIRSVIGVALGAMIGAAEAQPILEIDAGEVLSLEDLQAGSFDGQAFELAPELTIEVSGTIGPVRLRTSPFDFQGSTIDINADGLFATGSLNPGRGDVAHAVVSVLPGGNIDTGFTLGLGASLLATGGRIGSGFRSYAESSSVFEGGRIAPGAGLGGPTVIRGGEFMLDNEPISSFESFPNNSILTGTLQDGTPFIFASGSYRGFGGPMDWIAPGSVTLELRPLPAVAEPMTISDGPAASGLRAGEVLTLTDDGYLPRDAAAVGATLDVAGGTVGEDFEAVATTITLTDGEIGDSARLYSGSTLAVTGGHLGSECTVFPDASLCVSGGSVGPWLQLLEGSTTTLEGGTLDRGLYLAGLAQLLLRGGEFELDGTPIQRTGIRPTGENVLTGTLADGSVIVLSRQLDDFFRAGVLFENVSLPPTRPITVIDDGAGPTGLRRSETLVVLDGGSIPRTFSAVGATLVIDGGSVDADAELVETEVVMHAGSIGANLRTLSTTSIRLDGGTIGDDFHASGETELSIDGGSVGERFQALGDTTVNLIAGTIGERTELDSDTTLNISGGVLGNSSSTSGSLEMSGGLLGGDFDAYAGSDVSISGGQVGAHFDAYSNSDVTITGGAFGRFFDARDGSHVEIFGGTFDIRFEAEGCVLLAGGTIADQFFAIDGCEVQLTGTSIGDDAVLARSSRVEMSGGSFGDRLWVHPLCRFEVSGGTIGCCVRAEPESELRFVVRNASINGAGLGIQPGETRIIEQRDHSTLDLILADGSHLDIVLSDEPDGGADVIDVAAVLAVTRVICTCEVAGDPTRIDIVDLLAFVDLWLAGDSEADISGTTGDVDLADLLVFLDCWLRSSGDGLCR